MKRIVWLAGGCSTVIGVIYIGTIFFESVVKNVEMDVTPLSVETIVAFPNLEWAGWNGETDRGKLNPLRPIILTHAGDGRNRVFVATQQGVIHVFPNEDQACKTKVFLDIQSRVVFDEAEIEEGFLGLAFHPHYAKNGEFFVFYTAQKTGSPHTNVLSRFRVSTNNPSQADSDSEEEILRIDRPFWNHNGGTICFGPDGYLYVAVGDGGSRGDPLKNGQNLNTLLAKILRIDVDRKDAGKNYSVPSDNPFVGRADARPETWAYGLRNVWRMAFDRRTGDLWAADVGQDHFEEINLIVRRGNYGWSLREGLHPFGSSGASMRKSIIDPIWEYSHAVGVCIVGGSIYRGKQLPELDGFYLYGDYVNGRIWALRYDDNVKRVVANRPIATKGLPILSFGEDEQGEAYFLTPTFSGKGIYQFARSGSTAH